MKKILLFCLVVCGVSFGYAQAICGFDKLHEKAMGNDPAYAKFVKANNEKIRQYIADHPASLMRTNVTYTIPVVVHIVHTGGVIGSTYNPTDAQVTGAINYLNQIYNGTHVSLAGGVGDMGIQFALAQRDPNCNATTGINRIDGSSLTNYVTNGVNFQNSSGTPDLTLKNLIRWNTADYYNIWVVNKIDGADGTSGQYFAGYAYFPGASSLLDGTVMLATQMVSGQKTLPHEMGHAFNLYHPFQGSSDNTVCPTNGNPTTDGDMVADTDPVTYNITAGIFDFTCRTGTNTCTSTAYNINTESNFMAYTNCYTLFTAGQKARVQAAVLLAGRSSLTTSLGATPPYSGSTTCTPKINFEQSSAVQTETTTITSGCRKYTDYTYYMTIGNNPTAAATATIAIAGGGTATEGVDFDITTNGSFAVPSKIVTFPSGAHANIAFTVRVYDDPIIESTESFTLNYTVNAGGGNAVAGTGNTTLTISILDNGDAAPSAPGATAIASVGTVSTAFTGSPFNATLQRQKSQYLYNASELTAAGIVAGNITALQLGIQTKSSNRAFTGFTIKMGNTLNTTLYNSGILATFTGGLTTVYTAASYTTTGNSWNSFTFSTPFVWDGTSNVGIEICFENATANGAAGADQTLLYNDGTANVTMMHQDDINCSQAFTSFSIYAGFKPAIKMTYTLTGNPVASTAVTSTSQYLGANADIYFYDATGKTMARIQNLNSFDYGCTQVTIDRTGTGSTQFWNSNTANYLTSKSLKIVPTNNSATGNFIVTLYYSSAEVTGWQTATEQSFSSAKLVKVANGFFIPDVTPAAQYLADISYATGSVGSFGTASTITGTFSSSKLSAGIAVGIPTTTTTWTGASSSAWALAGNWNNGVPDGSYDALIPNVATSPSITANQSVRNLTVNASASIAIASTFSLQIGGDLVHNGTVTGLGTATLNAGNAQSMSGTGTIANLTLNNSTGATISSGNTSITGTLTLTLGTLATGGFLTLKSDASGTARLAPVVGAISGNVTVERYVPAKSSRKWSFVTAPVTGTTVRNAWQQQVFVTGAGTGGAAACAGTTTGNGGGTDKYNSNGFDISVFSSPTMYSYNGAAGTGLRWTELPNTSTALVTGKGYRLNVRGARGASDANCSNQLNNPAPTAPTATTLFATGTLSTGDVPVTLDGVSGDYTLLGNPYASSIDFDLFNTDNASLAGKYWFYSPDNTASGIASTAYCAYTTGSMTNKPAGYTDANSKNIASGQSFFVQKAAAAVVTFKEAHKTSAQSGSFRTQSYDWSNAIRAGLQNADGSIRIDEVLVRFGNVTGASKNYTDAWDARSINEGAPVIVSLKGTDRLAIQTRPLNFSDDTVKLGVTINTIGDYRLAFSEYEAFTSALVIKLRDKFLGTEQDIKANAVYPFSVTADANSKGDNRFEIVFKSNGALPVSYIGITAKNKGNNDVEVNWQLPSETDVRKYEVERSADSRNFDVRGTVQSRGNSTMPQSYNFTDAPRLSGTSYYRVKATDKSGVINYSPTVKVSNGKDQLAVAIYPNPVKDKLNMVVQNVDGSYTIKISTLEGKTMLVQNGNTAAGNIVTINTAALATGVYMVETMDSKGNRSMVKMLKQ